MKKGKRGDAKKQPRKKSPARPPMPLWERESQTAEIATVAWAVLVTMVLVCDLTAVGAHFVYLGNPQLRGAAVLGGMMLAAGAILGVGVLVLLPVVRRIRRVPPPLGFTVFAACAAAAPLIAIAARWMQ
jgi:hypothetical protein